MRYIERLAEKPYGDILKSFYVDSGLTYSGSAVSSVSGLGHLEGETVAILADGKVMPEQVVKSGSVSIPITASRITVGLPITAEAQTLPVAVGTKDGGYGQGHDKNIVNVRLRVYQSSAIWAGPDADNLHAYKQRKTEPYGWPPALISKEAEILIAPRWSDSGSVYVAQKYPLPLMICGVNADVEL